MQQLAPPSGRARAAALLACAAVAAVPVLLAGPVVARAATPTGAAVQPSGGGFEPNRGQAPAAVRYLARTAGGLVALTGTGAEMVLTAAAPPASGPAARYAVPAPPARAVVAEQYLGASAPLQLGAASSPLAERVTVMHGNDPAAWQRDLPVYPTVAARNLYRGVDVAWAADGGLESTYTVAPGADPERIRWIEAGATAVRVDRGGDLHVTLPALGAGPSQQKLAAELIEKAPRAWQDTAGGRRSVPVAFSVDAAGTVGFTLGAYDHAQTLTIDPAVELASYLGGDDVPYGTAFTPDGDVVVTGHTGSTSFPVTPGAYQSGNAGDWDVYVTKYDPRSGALQWSTYVGSSAADGAFGLAVDPHGGAVAVTGFAGASDFPTTAGAYQAQVLKAGTGCNAFALRLSPDGSSLQASTLLGGIAPFPRTDRINVGQPDDEDLGIGIALGADGSMTLSGETSSLDLPVTMGAYQPVNKGGTADAFVAHVSADAKSLLASTYLGGLDYDFASGIALDPGGDVLVDGETDSTTFPTTAGADQASNGGGFSSFVARLSPDLSTLRWSTYYGGTQGSNGFQYTVPGNLEEDAQGNVLFAGETNALDLPVTPGTYQKALAGQNDAYVAAISADGASLRYATYYGGGSYDGAFSLAQDAAGDIWLAGYTSSSDLPVSDASHVAMANRYHAGFVAELSPGATALLAARYVGGGTSADPGNEPVWDEAYTIATDGQGDVATAGITDTTDFPVTSDAPQRHYGGGYLADWTMVLSAAPAVAVPESPLPAVTLLLSAAAAALLRARRRRSTPATR